MTTHLFQNQRLKLFCFSLTIMTYCNFLEKALLTVLLLILHPVLQSGVFMAGEIAKVHLNIML